MATAPGSLVARMLGAARLDAATYEVVERDPAATGQASAVVALVTIAAVGSWPGASAVELAAVLLVAFELVAAAKLAQLGGRDLELVGDPGVGATLAHPGADLVEL